jgi:hypothetical protein
VATKVWRRGPLVPAELQRVYELWQSEFRHNIQTSIQKVAQN